MFDKITVKASKYWSIGVNGMILRLGYGGSIGLEYAPKNDTSSGLKWLKDYSD